MKSSVQRVQISCGIAQLPFWVGTFNEVVTLLLEKKRNGKVILPCTLYDLARVNNEAEIANIYRQVDVMTTDGMPLVWWFRLRFRQTIERVYGPDILASVLQQRPTSRMMILCPNSVVYTELKSKFQQQIRKRTLRLIEVGDSTADNERKRLAEAIRAFAPEFVWIGVGSPNQVLLGVYFKKTIRLPITYWCVGAAIPFLAGTVQQAPRWMQQHGLEWFFRLLSEPRRLWQRYLVITPVFLFQLLFARIRNTSRSS
jgi:N-acetylglucosaminyldiphosphoundecaprenol N-acetyl-beta-D-mannosaminyltransferase